MNEKYKALATPPENALKPIKAGNLKGKSDINPQWRIEALTEQFGLCGFGWRYEVVDKIVQPLDDGQIMLFMQINLYIKDGDAWSDPIPGFGGDMIREKNKNGLVANDEAYKMCLTDALGTAAKNIGVAADIYRGLYDSKYSREEEAAEAPRHQSQQPAQNRQQPRQNQQPTWGKDGDYYCVYSRGKKTVLTNMTTEQLEWVASKNSFPEKMRQQAKDLLVTGAA